jgi:phage-related minor tail protein
MTQQGGSTGFFGSLLGGLLGVGHADGGPVTAGKMYPVGERGPELFMPGTSGTIIPNHNLGSGGGIQVFNDFRGVDAATTQYVDARVRQGVQAAIQGAQAKIADRQRRS